MVIKATSSWTMSKISTIVVIVASPTASTKILMIKLLWILTASTLSLELTRLLIFFCCDLEGSLLQNLLVGDLFLLLCVVVPINFHESRACCEFLLGLMIHAQR